MAATATPETSVTLTMAELKELLGAQPAAQGLTADLLEAIMTRTAEISASSMKKAMKPENEFHPDKSVFNYPEGNREHPKTLPPFEVLYNGYPVTKFPETQHWRELELFAQVRPGTYTVLRKDGSRMDVVVDGQTDADGKLTKIDIHFPISRDEKFLIPPQMVVLYQLVYSDNPRQRFVEAMQEWLGLTIWTAVPA